MLVKQSFDSIIDIQNLPLAATIFAHDVPLHPAVPFTVISGDGIKGKQVIFHFGTGGKVIAAQWFDSGWIAANPNSSVAFCRDSFSWMEKMRNHIKDRRGIDETKIPLAVHTRNSRMAAILCRLGHPVKARWVDSICEWNFPEAAATDAALLHNDRLYDMMPTAPIAYARAALFGHMAMLDFIGRVTHYRVAHKGRTAIIGRNMPKDKMQTIEKLLYRK